jgi:hypothetical protein
MQKLQIWYLLVCTVWRRGLVVSDSGVVVEAIEDVLKISLCGILDRG